MPQANEFTFRLCDARMIMTLCMCVCVSVSFGACLYIGKGGSALPRGLELLWYPDDHEQTARNHLQNERSSTQGCEASFRMRRRQLSILPSITGAEHYNRIWRRLLLLLAASKLSVFRRGFHPRLVDSDRFISATWLSVYEGEGEEPECSLVS